MRSNYYIIIKLLPWLILLYYTVYITIIVRLLFIKNILKTFSHSVSSILTQCFTRLKIYTLRVILTCFFIFLCSPFVLFLCFFFSNFPVPLTHPVLLTPSIGSCSVFSITFLVVSPTSTLIIQSLKFSFRFRTFDSE